MARPLTLVYQELAQQNPTVDEPDLDTLLVAPAYQLLDYADDKANIQVANYGTLNADNPSVPPVAAFPAVIVVAPPELAAGAWVVPDSIRIHLDRARVVMSEGVNGATTAADNVLTSSGASFITDGVAAGDTLIIDNPGGPATPNLVMTVREVLSATTLAVSTNFLSSDTALAFRVERTLRDIEVDSSFVQVPTFRVSNEITLLGGITVPVATVERVVTYAEVYVGYSAYRTDLQERIAISPATAVTDIQTQLGKIDARNPAAAHAFVVSQNAGSAPFYVFCPETDDLAGYAAVRDAISSDKETHAIVLGTSDLAILAMFNASNVTLASPLNAETFGVPQKFRIVIGAAELETEVDIVEEVATGTTEPLAGAIPPGVRRITFASADFLAALARPGDQLVLSASSSSPALDGTYTISHINAANVLELDTALPATVAAPAGVNYRVVRPSTGATVLALVDGRATVTLSAVVVTSRVAGVAAGSRTIAFVQNDTTSNGIHLITEVANTSTVVEADFTGGLITTAMVVAALNAGTGVTTPFSGSVNVVASTATPATFVAAVGATLLSSGTAGVNTLTSTAVLDEAYLRLFDASATFIEDGVIPGDHIELPSVPNGTFGASVRRFVVDQVVSEQRLTIQNAVSGSYVNNSSSVESELPHFDNRLGTGTLVTQGTLRYRVRRQLTKDQQVASIVAAAQSVRSMRAVLVWSNSVTVSGLTDGSLPRLAGNVAAPAARQPGTYLGAAVGGMCAGLPNHQGFTNLGCAGIDRVHNSQGYFTEEQLTELSEGGVYVFVQDSPNSLPYTIHQLTTDPSALQTGELSMVRNFDYLSKFYAAILDEFRGKWNQNEETLGFMAQAVNAGTQLLKSRRVARIGAPLTDAAIVSLAPSTLSPDRVELYLGLDRPKPLNTIGLHLIG